MKRSPLKRGDKPLARKTPLRARAKDGLRRTRLAPISAKQREKKAVQKAQVAAEARAFREAIRGQRCVVCGRTEAEALEETGHGHEAHHVIRKEVLKRLRLERLLWAPAAAVCLCEEPCHRRHTSRKTRVPYLALPRRAVQWALDEGLSTELLAEYEA